MGGPQAATVAGAGDAFVLVPGKAIDREIGGRQHDAFQIELPAGRLDSISIEHPGLDLKISLLDPQRNLVIESESRPGEAQGLFEFVAKDPGSYQLQLEAKYPNRQPGKYRIRMADLRPADPRDLALDQARREYSEALRLYRKDTYAQAQAAAERALGLREKALGPDDPEIAEALNALGLICSARFDYNRAEELFQRALAINEKVFGKDSLRAAESADNLARNYNNKANYSEAERLARRALAIRQEHLGDDDFLVAVSLESLGQIFFEKAEYPQARSFADHALEIAAKSYAPQDLPYTDFVTLVARTKMRQGDYAGAEQLFLQCLHRRETGGGSESLQAANSLQDLGWLYLLKIDNAKAEQMYLRALDLKEKLLGRDPPQSVNILHGLGLIYYRREDYSTADSFYQRSLAVKEKFLGPDHPLVAATLNNLGLMYWKQRDYAKAAEHFRRALAIEEKTHGSDSLEITYALMNLGIIAKETGDYDTAEKNYRRVLAIKERVLGPIHPDVGIVVESLGILYKDKGDYARAEPYFLRSIEITEKSMGPDHPDNARHYRNLAELYAAAGELPATLRSFERVAEIQEKELPLNLAMGSERQKLAYFGPMNADLERIISFQVQLDSTESAARDLALSTLVQRKGRVLDVMADSFGTLWNRSNADDRVLLDHLKDVTSKLAALVLNGPQKSSIAEQQNQIKSLAKQREQLENEASRRSAGYFQGNQSVTLATVRSAIPGDAALVEFAVYRPFDPKTRIESTKRFGEPRYVAYVVPRQGAVRWKDLGPAGDIDAAVLAFRAALRDPERSDVKQLARTLDAKIMQPLRAFTGDAKHLLISPDGQLDLIPFEALVNQDGSYVVESQSISYLTTGRDLLRMQVQRASKSAPVVIADPAFGEPETMLARADAPRLSHRSSASGRRRSITTGEDLSAVYFAPLSGTAQEARVIHSLFPEAHVLTGVQASKAALRQLDAPSILHIATHGFFLQDSGTTTGTAGTSEAANTRAIHASVKIENPLLRSGLALSGANLNNTNNEDGILTALEASNLNLWGTKLVTLSACETGVGEVKNGEGVYGLRRSFFLAGAETLVMSLWPVSDQVTREMMTAYYTGLKHGLGRGEALRQAELSMLKRKGREHPFYWASFIQSGEWANLDGRR